MLVTLGAGALGAIALGAGALVAVALLAIALLAGRLLPVPRLTRRGRGRIRRKAALRGGWTTLLRFALIVRLATLGEAARWGLSHVFLLHRPGTRCCSGKRNEHRSAVGPAAPQERAWQRGQPPAKGGRMSTSAPGARTEPSRPATSSTR